jgi:hypothetical protein
MKRPAHAPLLLSSPRLSSALLLLAATACSGDYPLGQADDEGFLTEGTDVARPGTSGLIGLPDETFSLEDDEGIELGGVTAIGDLDGDGFDDLMAAGWDEAQRTAFVQVHYGSARAARGTGIQPFDLTGTRLQLPRQYGDAAPMLTPAGDVNGDGYADVLVQRRTCRFEASDLGAYLVYGGPERFSGTVALEGIAAAFLTPPKRLPRSRTPMCDAPLQAAAGDLDGDGFDDLVLKSSVWLPDDHSTSGAAHVFYGGPERFSGAIPAENADAQLLGSDNFFIYVAPDLNGDGRADLFIENSETVHDFVHSTVYFFPGAAQRLSGEVDVASSAIHLEAELEPDYALGALDLDGDRLNEMMLRGADGLLYLFYGAPDLFADGAPLTGADAVFDGDFHSRLTSAGDRDGDGDSELLQVFEHYRGSLGEGAIYDGQAGFEAALLSGEQTRLSGIFSVPGADAPARQHFADDPARSIQTALAAGDLDHDGIGDLLTQSAEFATVGPLPGNGLVYDSVAPQLHVYYGVPAIARVY